MTHAVIALLVLLAGYIAGYLFLPANSGKKLSSTLRTQCIPPNLDNAESTVVRIPAGRFIMGDNRSYPEERHEHPVELDAFLIDRHEVTNAQFARFVAATGYVTTAEREPDPALFKSAPKELIQPGSAVFLPPDTSKAQQVINNGWSYLPGASWRHPDGPDSDIKGKDAFPVVQVSFDDALAYAQWLGRDLPTEAQFEYASRGGLTQGRFAWAGNELTPRGKHKANTWQGIFPLRDSGSDGFSGTAPVGCFAANGFGLHDMIGNVWEWTQDNYAPGHSSTTASNPQGPNKQSSFDPRQPGVPVRVIKGGSYLCADNFCQRYRPAARQAQETGLGTNHIGFRTVVNLQQKDVQLVQTIEALANEREK